MDTLPSPEQSCSFKADARHLRPFGVGSLDRATPTVTRELGSCGLTRRTTPFSRLLLQTRGSRDLFQPKPQIMPLREGLLYLKQIYVMPLLLKSTCVNHSLKHTFFHFISNRFGQYKVKFALYRISLDNMYMYIC